ncbi:LemA family protein [Thermus thermamylovorans]|uniref:LemA family protein n=1 Tax=Thermus thermamylovorans TaxID=2509362 RepID=A0A4Q9B5Y9_9DEIN|nr:LemA family protein [Thermus thermamylovorans]TBH20810.1 LemA family protein [Thermus thermamylovorans]
MDFLWVVLALGLLALLVLPYNALIARKNQVENAFGAVEAQLKKRRDLIPGLVAAVQAYMAHERELLERLTRLREAAAGAATPEEEFRLEEEVSRLLREVRLRAEAYPDLKASQNFLQLQAALAEAEDAIAAARRFYNQAVTEYNNAVEQVPTLLYARLMGLGRKPVFTLPEEERLPPDLGRLFRG